MKTQKKTEVKGYTWRKGSHHKVSATVAGKEIQRLLKERGGELEADDVVQSASSPASPLHREFEWDDTKAAREHRLCQARNLMNSIQVTLVGKDEEPITMSVFVAVQTEEEKRYMDVTVAMGDSEKRENILAQALRELKAFQRKYGNLKELATVIEAIGSIKVTT